MPAGAKYGFQKARRAECTPGFLSSSKDSGQGQRVHIGVGIAAGAAVLENGAAAFGEPAGNQAALFIAHLLPKDLK